MRLNIGGSALASARRAWRTKWRATQPVAWTYDKIMRKDRSISVEVDANKARIVEIEINKNCNLNCTMCNTRLSTRPNMNMDLDLFEQTLLKAKGLKANKGKSLRLHTIGEPLINPLLKDYFALVRKHGLTIVLSSNLLPLKKKIDLICEYADIITVFRFSIDGASKETYEAIRKPGKFEKLIESLELFKQVNAGGKYFKNVKVNSIVSTDVQHELAHHVDFYSQYVPMENIQLMLVNGLSPDNTYFLEKSVLKNHIQPSRPCHQLGSPRTHVLNDGRVSACCRDYNGELVFGNIHEQSVKELVNNDTIKNLRRQNIDNTAPKGSLCDTCFCVDPRVNDLFDFFSGNLITQNKADWHVPRMQARYDAFFDSFGKGIPTREEFASLCD